jgi:hypothetical protein
MDTPTAVVTAGTDLLAAAVEAQAVPVTRVDWRPVPRPSTHWASSSRTVTAVPVPVGL